MTIVETPHRLGGGRWLLVHADTGAVIDLHGEAVLIERRHESDVGTRFAGPVHTSTRFELRAEPVDDVHYTGIAPTDAVVAAVRALTAEVSR